MNETRNGGSRSRSFLPAGSRHLRGSPARLTVWALRSSCRYDPFPVGDECNEMESGEGDDKRIEPRSTGNAERQRLDQ